MYSAFCRRRLFAFVFLGIFVLAAVPVRAASGDPVSQIESFYAALLESMKQGKALDIEGRYKKLAPVIEETFDLREMTSIAVGPAWSSIPADKQAALVDAFKHMTVATYARNFNSYDGERFEVDPNVITRNSNRIVRTRLIQPGKEPVSLSYLMHQTGSGWKVIDVYYMGTISQLAARRSEFSGILRDGGPDALEKRLRELGDRLMTGN